MSFSSAGRRRILKTLGLAAALVGVASVSAMAQPIIWHWGPSPGYGLVPPAPIYRPVAPRYAPVPVYPDDDFEPAPRARRLSGGDVSRMLRARGMRVTAMPTRNGGVFVADVEDRNGNPRRVIIDGYYGRVLQTFPSAAFRPPQPAGPRYAGRPPEPDVDTDIMPPAGNGPSVIPGIGPRGEQTEGQRPRATQQKKKQPAKKVATRPPAQPKPSAMPVAPASPAAPMTPPLQEAAPPVAAPPPAAALPPPAVVRPAPAPVTPVAPPPATATPIPAAPAPVTPAAREAAVPPAEAPVTPPSAPAPATGAAGPATEPPSEPTTERPRRRVRFIRPDTPAQPNPNVPGGQLVPIPEPPPVVLTPRPAGSPAGGGTAAAPVPSAPLE